MKRSEEMLELPAQEEEVFGAARLTVRREGFAPPEQSCLTPEAAAVAAGVVGAATVDCESSVTADSTSPTSQSITTYCVQLTCLPCRTSDNGMQYIIIINRLEQVIPLVPLVLVLIPDGAPPMTVYDDGDADHQSQQGSLQH